MAITNTLLSTTHDPIFESTSPSGDAITTIIFCNTDAYDNADPTANTSLLTVHIVPSGDDDDDRNMIVNQLPIPAGETMSLDQEKLVLSKGDKVIAYTNSASNIAATVSSLAV